jgi:hypothetical protein
VAEVGFIYPRTVVLRRAGEKAGEITSTANDDFSPRS